MIATLFLALLSTAQTAPPITAAAFTPDGQSVLAGSQAGIVCYAWPQLGVRGSIATSLQNIHDLAFSPAGDMVLAAGGAPAQAGRIELLRWPQRETAREIVAGDDVAYSVHWRRDGGAFIAALGDGRVRMFDQHGAPLHVYQGHSRAVLAARFLDDNRLVSAGRDQSLRLWDAVQGRAIRTLDQHTDAVSNLAVRPGMAATAQPWIASIGDDLTMRLWQPTLGRLIRFARLPSQPLALEWTAAGSHVVVACADGRLRVIDPETVEIVHDLPALDGWAYTLVRAPHEGAFLVAGAGGQMRRIVIPVP